ncbi:NAD(P)/FAD-dependent oxidoreductase [Plasticicumulans acidivorans]|uniref:NADPH-dependent 2,4-dienoyl-CoA reductase/sulfur reductase-like enzyme n=1 Tax=Plasticicumulans acidivorans TaxID=886464 RepID=A0A317MXT4_9GAMM|nr:FAD/NAD(P)-binding oxidoreductase [Plasticicumulans acidivorans]PWV64423.1 NADPH-dependent 2,4-dienoyl-CoA reductase/sulfur reductase-like enzyme [Plasticicumulans acidivorans]
MKRAYDLAIIGAGPAGISAALAAAASGARIALLDDNPVAGGQIWRDGPQVRLPALARRLRAELAAQANVDCFAATRVVALAGPRGLLLEDEQRGWRLDYARLILCTGARELLLPFPGWTLPGVSGAGGLQALLHGGLPVHGERVVIAGSGPLLLACAASARRHGARVQRIAEQAAWSTLARFAAGLPRWPGKLWQSLRLLDPAYRGASHVIAALGRERLEGVRLRQGGQIVELECERLACGFGLVANTEIAQALGCALRDDAIAVNDWQATACDGIYAAGECTGCGGSELALLEGSIAGYAAVDEHARAQALWPQRQRWQRFAEALRTSFALDPALRHLAAADTLVCRCEDVPYAALAGHAGWHAAKLASRCGMGACQGRVCGAAARTLFGWSRPAPRPPFTPARIATLLELDDEQEPPCAP